MDSSTVAAILRGIGADRVRVVSHDKVSCCCPLAWWTHPKGRDSRPSMAVLLEDGHAHYTCLSCHERGSLRRLLMFLWTRGQDTFRWIEVLDGEEPVEKAARGAKKLKRDFRRGSRQGFDPKAVVPTRPPLMVPTEKGRAFYDYKAVFEAEQIEPLPEESYEPYAGSVPRYALDRGLTIETCREWGLGNDREMKRLLFPIRDRKGRLVAISGRIYVDGCPRCGGHWIQPCEGCGEPELAHFDDGGKLRCADGDTYRPTRSCCSRCGLMQPPKYLHSKGFKRNSILYGEHRQEMAPDGRVYVVEGHLDMIKMWQAGYRPVVALLGSHPGEAQIEKLIKYWEKIIVVPDGNSAGQDMGRKVTQMVANRIPVRFVKLEDGLDPGAMTDEQFLRFLGPPPFAKVA